MCYREMVVMSMYVLCYISVQVKEIKLRQQNWMKQRTQSLSSECSIGVFLSVVAIEILSVSVYASSPPIDVI